VGTTKLDLGDVPFLHLELLKRRECDVAQCIRSGTPNTIGFVVESGEQGREHARVPAHRQAAQCLSGSPPHPRISVRVKEVEKPRDHLLVPFLGNAAQHFYSGMSYESLTVTRAVEQSRENLTVALFGDLVQRLERCTPDTAISVFQSP
jgi:hypothetical protein